MILLYGFIISVVIIIILFIIERDEIARTENTNLQIADILLIVGGSIIGSLSLALRVFLQSYFTIVINDKSISGPSLFGMNYRTVTIELSEIKSISKNPLLVLLGFYIIKSVKGEIICITGFDEGQFEKLMGMINNPNLSALNKPDTDTI